MKQFRLNYIKDIWERCSKPIPPDEKRLETELRVVNDWTMNEAIEYVNQHPEMSTSEALESFVKLMDHYACIARTDDSAFIFSNAKAMAQDIYDSYNIAFYWGRKGGKNA